LSGDRIRGNAVCARFAGQHMRLYAKTRAGKHDTEPSAGNFPRRFVGKQKEPALDRQLFKNRGRLGKGAGFEHNFFKRNAMSAAAFTGKTLTQKR
jgi:hypothetical protein